VGGTIHVIVNNQVGFTTNPDNARSTMYCSDLGKAFDIPIFHCNGDDPMAVVTAFEMAVEWRQQFGQDCIIDMICYRRFGHNELDEPFFTQPVMYKNISKHPTPLKVFEERLVSSGKATQEELDGYKASTEKALSDAYQLSKTWVSPPDDWLSAKWAGFLGWKQTSRIRPTGVSIELLKDIGIKSSTLPENLKVHKQLVRIFKARNDSIVSGVGIDWATAEALAFGSLLREGNHVRLTGQDVQRGTFSHRHAVIVDQETGETYTPLNNLATNHYTCGKEITDKDSQALFTVRNSILSEFGVLGFEHGYSLVSPNMLVLWEAQFGDFVNGAQIMIDQFITAGEDKWLRQNGLVMLLPHGYMGQGAEHSSCRLERFLQEVSEDESVVPVMDENERKQIQLCNIQVVNCTTPANYYHVLRRQIHREFRKPLIIATPKNLLREKKCTSTLDEMGPNTRFKRVIAETNQSISQNADKVTKVIFCSGKIYYELVDERESSNRNDVAIIRIEQLAPFPWDHVAKQVSLYKNATVTWAQEEPRNMGPWSYIEPRMKTATRVINNKEMSPHYVGRDPSAATATGLGGVFHNKEQALIIKAAFA